MSWQPIETAPKDGTVILGWRYYAVAMKWTGHHGYPWEAIHLDGVCELMGNGFVSDDNALTHWMPLPDPPRSSDENG